MSLPIPLLANQIIDPGSQLANLEALIAQISANINGTLFADYVSHSTTTGTTEQTMSTYSLPASTLLNAGWGLRMTAFGQFAANGNNKTVKLYFGSEVLSSGVLTTNNKNWWGQLLIMKTAASAQIVHGNFLADTTWVTPYNVAGAETDTSAITMKVTAQDGTSSAADIVVNGVIIEILR